MPASFLLSTLLLLPLGGYFQPGDVSDLQKKVLDLSQDAINKQTEVTTLEFKLGLLIDWQKGPSELLKELGKEGAPGSPEIKEAKENIIRAIQNKIPRYNLGATPLKNQPTNYSLSPKYIDKQAVYYAFLKGIEEKESLHGFSWVDNQALPPPSYNVFGYFGTILFCFIAGVALVKMNVVGVRRYIRMKHNPDFTVIRWLGFGFLFPLILASCSGPIHISEKHHSQALEEEKTKLFKEIQSGNARISTLNTLIANKVDVPIFNILKGVDFTDLEKAIFDEIENQKINTQDGNEKAAHKKMDDLVSQANLLQRQESFRFWFVWGFFFCSLATALTTRFKLKAYQRQNSETCPRCFERGKLKPAPEGKGLMQCHSDSCKLNRFRIESLYMGSPKISIPVAGWTSSGKTSWLAMAYGISGKFISSNTGTATQKVLYDLCAADHPEFNRIGDDMSQRGHSGGPSVQPFLDRTITPLFISVKDNRNLGGVSGLASSSGLALCFDYGGELVKLNNRDFESTKSMVARSNGLVYFLDPTQVDHTLVDLTNYRNQKTIFPIEKVTADTKSQIQALINVAADFKKARGFPVSTPLDIPVAVCIPKIDVILEQGPLKGKYGNYFLDKLKAEFRDQSVSLSKIHRRSDIVKQFLPILFAHEEMVSLLENAFGANFCLFPIASKGFDQSQNSECVGVLEPILWLLHMHGLNVVNA